MVFKSRKKVSLMKIAIMKITNFLTNQWKFKKILTLLRSYRRMVRNRITLWIKILLITNKILACLINIINLDLISNKINFCKTNIRQMDKVLRIIKWMDRGCKLNRMFKNLKIVDRTFNVKVSNKFLNNKISNNNNKTTIQTKMVKFLPKLNIKIAITLLFNKTIINQVLFTII